MKVFLTGGSGYIGRATIGELVRQGHTVSALARSDRAAAAVTEVGAVAVRGRLDDVEVLNDATTGAEAVIHLAQATSGEEDLAAASAMQDGLGAGPYLHTGGTWVYGDTDGVVDENAPWKAPAVVAWREPVERAVLDRARHGGRPVVVRPGLLYGGDNRLIDAFFLRPGQEVGSVPCIGAGDNHWALVHVDDLARLYIAALAARPGSVYVGVGGVNPTAREVLEAAAKGRGLAGTVTSISLEQAREQMGPIADAFALDQQLTAARATAELGWVPDHTDPLTTLARG